MDDDFGLKTFIEGCKLLRLNDSAHAAEILLKIFSQKGYLDTGVAEDLNTTFLLEYSQRGDREEREFEILVEIIWSAINKRKTSGKSIILNFKDYQRIKELDKSLGIIYDEFHSGSITDRNKMLLLCLGHIVRWEVRGQDVKYQLEQIGNISFSQRKHDLDKLINKFLMIETLGSDEKPDTFHIRNAVAHGRFRFHKDDILELWDVKQGTETETFRTKKDIKRLTYFCYAFETKLHFVSLYYSFLIMMKKISESIEKHNRNKLKTK
jgi:hypothetical protein